MPEPWALPDDPPAEALPRALLYATSARLGGSGLDVSALQGALAAQRGGFLAEVLAYANQQEEIPSARVRSGALQAARLLSFLGSQRYYGAKKHWLDRNAARAVRSGRFDFLHTWSGDALRSLIAAADRGIPSVMDIPTWHRNKGRIKPFLTKSEREAAALRGWAGLSHRLLVSRQQMLMEYELATLLLMPSVRSAETFAAAGLAAHRLHYVGRGVDVQRWQPGAPPDRVRFIFVGALILRKGVHRLLEAWKQLGLTDAELVLVGEPHPELKPWLRDAPSNVRVTGFTRDVPALLRTASCFVFPSECEGFAKATLEAAACGLPLIATRESGDAVVDGETGWVVPPDDAAALAGTMEAAARDPDAMAARGRAARQRVERWFTWDHYRLRLRAAYAKARSLF